MGGLALRYMEQDSPQTLAEGLEEYYARNPGLLAPSGLPPEAAELFRQHDAGHVVFGCDTSPRGETLIDTWTVFGTTAGLRGYLRYFGVPQVNQIFAETGYARIVAQSVRCLPDALRVIARSRRLASPWPWERWEGHLGQRLADIRREFRIRVV
jgi:hypothetical protein